MIDNIFLLPQLKNAKDEFYILLLSVGMDETAQRIRVRLLSRKREPAESFYSQSLKLLRFSSPCRLACSKFVTACESQHVGLRSFGAIGRNSRVMSLNYWRWDPLVGTSLQSSDCITQVRRGDGLERQLLILEFEAYRNFEVSHSAAGLGFQFLRSRVDFWE